MSDHQMVMINFMYVMNNVYFRKINILLISLIRLLPVYDQQTHICFMRDHQKNNVITKLGVHQYAMQSNCTTKLVLAAHNTLANHPSWVMVCPNAKNAFNAQN